MKKYFLLLTISSYSFIVKASSKADLQNRQIEYVKRWIKSARSGALVDFEKVERFSVKYFPWGLKFSVWILDESGSEVHLEQPVSFKPVSGCNSILGGELLLSKKVIVAICEEFNRTQVMDLD